MRLNKRYIVELLTEPTTLTMEDYIDMLIRIHCYHLLTGRKSGKKTAKKIYNKTKKGGH